MEHAEKISISISISISSNEANKQRGLTMSDAIR